MKPGDSHPKLMFNYLKKRVSRKFIEEYKFWEKMNNLERFYVIQKQPPEMLI